MLMKQNAAASKAGVVYMLSCRSITVTVTPCSPMNDRQACRADTYKRYANVEKQNKHYASVISPGHRPGLYDLNKLEPALPGPRMKPKA